MKSPGPLYDRAKADLEKRFPGRRVRPTRSALIRWMFPWMRFGLEVVGAHEDGASQFAYVVCGPEVTVSDAMHGQATERRGAIDPEVEAIHPGPPLILYARAGAAIDPRVTAHLSDENLELCLLEGVPDE